MGTPPNAPPPAPQVIQTPAPIHVAKYARNGLVPHAAFESDVAASLNFAGAVRTKQLFAYACPLDAIPNSKPTTRTRWRFAAHTGPLLRRLRVIVYVASQNAVGAGGFGSNPSVTIAITNADESTTYGSETYSFGRSTVTGSDVPSEFGYGEVFIACPADMDIYGKVDDVDGGRLIAATVYEESLPLLASNGYVAPSQVSVNAPIYDQRRQTMYELATKLWKGAAAHLWNWTAADQASPRTTASSTWTNIVDGTSTSVSASTPGATLDLRYCRTLSQTTVPCVLKIYGSMESSGVGKSGDVRILNSSGTVIATASITSTTAGWASTTVNMPATNEKFDIQARSADNLNSFYLGAVSLYQYVA